MRGDIRTSAFSDDSIQMLEADVVFGTVTVSSPAKTGTGFNKSDHSTLGLGRR